VIDGGAAVVQLSQSDLLWAARATSGEVLPKSNPEATDDDAADVLWTLTQRHAWWLQQGKTFSFAHTVRGFSQPISPKWASADASGCQAHPELCSEAKLAQRQALIGASWAELRARDEQRGTLVVAAVRAWAEGRLPNTVPGVTNFATPAVAQNHVEGTSGSRVVVKRGGHWYISDPPATRWPVNYVVIEGADGRVAGVEGKRRWRRHVASAAAEFWDTITLQSFWR
jgi:hypothetical protein